MRTHLTPILLLASAAVLACSKGDNKSAASDSTTAASSSPTSSTSDSANGPVRGRLVSLTDTAVTVSSRNGDVTLAVASPLTIYTRVPARLADVKSNSFVGVTSVPQPDGSQRATEIHIFPEQLRGMGEGSRPMGRFNGGAGGGGGGGGGTNSMTNGTVSGSQMTNGTASTMTNGTISGQKGGTLTVQYQGGTQTITVPANVSVTSISPTQTKPPAGSNVVVITTKQSDGPVKASAIMIAGQGGPGGRRRP